MIGERIPTIVLVNSPQNSKDSSLVSTDLLNDPVFRGVVRTFDRALKIGDNESLREERQMASVVMSVATHSTFVYRLRQNFPENRVNFRVVGHSVGEMGSFILADVAEIETVAWILDKRQEITERPLQSTVRFMVACVGIDMSRFEANLGQITDAFGGRVKAVLSNVNTASDGVLSMEAPEGETPRSIAGKLADLYKEFKPNDSERPPGFVYLKQVKNAFHSYMLGPEELLFQHIIDPEINEYNFRQPEPGMIYSPMLSSWITTRDQALYVMRHQLTSSVHFSQGIENILKIPDLRLFVTSDIKEDVSPKIVRDNVDGRVPVLNIRNEATLENAVETTTILLQRDT